MKKVLLLVLLVIVSITTISADDPIWLKTNGLKVTVTKEWSNYWIPCEINIKLDIDNDIIVIYSQKLQSFNIVYDYSPYIQGTSQIYKYQCKDIDYKNCNMYFFYDYTETRFTSIVIEYADGMYAYKL